MTKVSVEFDKSEADFLIWVLDQTALEVTDSMYYDYEDDETIERIDKMIAVIKEATNG